MVKLKPQIKWTIEKIEYLKKEYPLGYYKDMCEYLKISRKALNVAAQRFKIKSEKDTNFYKLKILYNNTNINYYWYGYIMADGYLSVKGELKVAISNKDYTHLEKLSLLLKSNIHIKERQTVYKKAVYCILSCKDVIYGVKLRKKLNIIDKKTYNAPSLSFIKNKKHFLAFLAGFIDGDGHIEYYTKKTGDQTPSTIRIMCHGNWYTNLEFLQKCLDEYLNIKSTIKYSRKTYPILTIYKKDNILKLKEEFLKMKLPIMERKWKL